LKSSWLLNCAVQHNILQWELTDLTWDLPTCIGHLAWELVAIKSWLDQGGSTLGKVVLPDATVPHASSEGESELHKIYEALPSPSWVIPKVRQADLVKHTLNKGVWAAATPMVQQGGEIFIQVSHLRLSPTMMLTSCT